jgi:hypothetical protein
MTIKCSNKSEEALATLTTTPYKVGDVVWFMELAGPGDFFLAKCGTIKSIRIDFNDKVMYHIEYTDKLESVDEEHIIKKEN